MSKLKTFPYLGIPLNSDLFSGKRRDTFTTKNSLDPHFFTYILRRKFEKVKI